MQPIEREETDQIQQREGRVHPALIVVFAVLAVVCVVYFVTNLARP